MTRGELIRFETVTTEEAFSALGGRGWDELVRAMPRPSPFLLHAWLVEWWRHFGEGYELRVHVAFDRDSMLAGALPLFVGQRFGRRVGEFLGRFESALADLLLRAGEEGGVAEGLARRASSGDHDLVDLFGLPAGSLLVRTLGPRALSVVERVEAPVLDLSAGWSEVYRAKTSSKKRNLHGRRRRQLGELGKLEIEVARSPDEIAAALEDALRLHELRWAGRPDSSEFVTPRGRAFHRAGYRALAELDVPRIVTLRLDGRAIAFHSYFAFCGAMYVHRLAFDPELGRFSPGLVNTLDALEAASAEGLTRVEFLGGAERYKIELADRLEPLYEAVGLPRNARARAFAAARVAAIRLRLRLKRSERLTDLYYNRLPSIDAWWFGGASGAKRPRQQSRTRS